MASITLKRKVLKNRHKAKNKNIFIKRFNAKPVVKNIDVQAIKESFKNNAPATIEEAPKEEVVDTKVEEAPVAEQETAAEEASEVKVEAETEETAKSEEKKDEE